jgi:hypothetical protein
MPFDWDRQVKTGYKTPQLWKVSHATSTPLESEQTSSYATSDCVVAWQNMVTEDVQKIRKFIGV